MQRMTRGLAMMQSILINAYFPPTGNEIGFAKGKPTVFLKNTAEIRVRHDHMHNHVTRDPVRGIRISIEIVI